MAVIQLMFVVDTFWVYCPEPLAWVPETVLFRRLPGKVQ